MTGAASTPPGRRAAWALGAVIAIATLAAYGRAVVTGGFIWDDDDYVTSNELLRGAEGLGRIWVPGSTHQYYPLVFTSFWIEHQLWGLSPIGYHLVNVLLHALSAVLVWRLFGRLGVPGAWMIGAVFALHPVHVESVAWVTERKNVLSGAFYLLGALAYLRFDRERFEERRAGRAWRWYAAALACLVAALLSKTVTCSLPAALILGMLYLRRRLTVARLLPLVPMFAVGLALAMHTAHLERTSVGAVGSEFDFSLADRLLIASKALVFYPAKLLWPTNLAFIYPRWALEPAATSSWWPAVLVLAAAAAVIVLYVRGRRGPALALAFFAGTLVPALGFFNVYPMRYSFVADHFQYLASLGIIALVVGAVARALPGRWPKSPTVGAAAALLLVLGGLTWRQTGRYTGVKALWTATLEVNPGCWMCHNNLGNVLRREGRAEAALPHFRAALELYPGHVQSRTNLAAALDDTGRHEEALEHWALVVAHEKAAPEDHFQMGLSFERLGRLVEAAGKYEDALRELAAEGRTSKLLFDANLRLGEVLAHLGRTREATGHLEAAVAADPSYIRARVLLASLYEGLDDDLRARDHYRAALLGARTEADGLTAAFGLARLLATTSDPMVADPAEAAGLAERLATITRGDDPAILNVLAAAYAGLGRNEQAREIATRALELARARGMDELAAEIEAQLGD